MNQNQDELFQRQKNYDNECNSDQYNQNPFISTQSSQRENQNQLNSNEDDYNENLQIDNDDSIIDEDEEAESDPVLDPSLFTEKYRPSWLVESDIALQKFDQKYDIVQKSSQQLNDSLQLFAQKEKQERIKAINRKYEIQQKPQEIIQKIGLHDLNSTILFNIIEYTDFHIFKTTQRLMKVSKKLFSRLSCRILWKYMCARVFSNQLVVLNKSNYRLICKLIWNQFKSFKYSFQLLREANCQYIETPSLRRDVILSLQFLNLYANLKQFTQLKDDQQDIFLIEKFVNIVIDQEKLILILTILIQQDITLAKEALISLYNLSGVNVDYKYKTIQYIHFYKYIGCLNTIKKDSVQILINQDDKCKIAYLFVNHLNSLGFIPFEIIYQYEIKIKNKSHLIRLGFFDDDEFMIEQQMLSFAETDEINMEGQMIQNGNINEVKAKLFLNRTGNIKVTTEQFTIQGQMQFTKFEKQQKVMPYLAKGSLKLKYKGSSYELHCIISYIIQSNTKKSILIGNSSDGEFILNLKVEL